MDDESILHAAARELWEESGLIVTKFLTQVGGEYVFFSRRGLRIGKANFVVEVEGGVGREPEVKLDQNEHDDYVWATEGECKAGRVAGTPGKEMTVTTKGQEEVVYEGFKWWRGKHGKM